MSETTHGGCAAMGAAAAAAAASAGVEGGGGGEDGLHSMSDVQDGGGAAAAAAGAAARGGEGGLHSSMIGRKHNEEYEFMRKGVELAETMQEEVAVAEGGAWPAVLPKTNDSDQPPLAANAARPPRDSLCGSGARPVGLVLDGVSELARTLAQYLTPHAHSTNDSIAPSHHSLHWPLPPPSLRPVKVTIVGFKSWSALAAFLPQTLSFGTDPQFLGHSIHPNAFYPKGSRKKGGGSGGLTQDQEALGGKHVVMISTGLSSFVAVPVVPYQEKIVSALEAEPSYGMPFVRQLVGGMSSFGVEQRRAPTKIQFGNGNGRAWSKAALLRLLQESCGNSILDDIVAKEWGASHPLPVVAAAPEASPTPLLRVDLNATQERCTALLEECSIVGHELRRLECMISGARQNTFDLALDVVFDDGIPILNSEAKNSGGHGVAAMKAGTALVVETLVQPQLCAKLAKHISKGDTLRAAAAKAAEESYGGSVTFCMSDGGKKDHRLWRSEPDERPSMLGVQVTTYSLARHMLADATQGLTKITKKASMSSAKSRLTACKYLSLQNQKIVKELSWEHPQRFEVTLFATGNISIQQASRAAVKAIQVTVDENGIVLDGFVPQDVQARHAVAACEGAELAGAFNIAEEKGLDAAHLAMYQLQNIENIFGQQPTRYMGQLLKDPCDSFGVPTPLFSSTSFDLAAAADALEEDDPRKKPQV